MKEMTPQEVQAYLEKNPEASVIDVREAAEVRAGKIPQAVNIPLGLIEFRKQELDQSKEHILVCRSGNRSGMAGLYLEGYGFEVINMTGGMLEWDGPTE
ncbi:rhodanese-like domain-containing protein [Indiicoccus explosivorum]|uniref:rhodanese-like domain-containing protein n=1 Tax=Indiicoccus explosivorum TaxID=1917864 RepID=UPI000B44BC60|nr:rhodanese-like domain-containing protein [Indiicoccus explosivorum]